MKQIFLICCAAGILASCNSETKPADTETKVKAASTEVSPAYAYTIEHPDQWEKGSKENTAACLQGLKDFESGNITACMKYFADSVELRMDYLQGKFSKDSVGKIFQGARAPMKDLTIKMDDFETVKSMDGKEEWVTLWYKQQWKDDKGMWDSVAVVNDFKIVNGKIAVLDEKIRHYPKKM